MPKYFPPRASTAGWNLGGSGLRECKTQNPFNPSESNVNWVTRKLKPGGGAFSLWCWLFVHLLSTEVDQYTRTSATEKKEDVCQASGPSENSTISPADKQIEVIKINKGKGFTKIFSERHLVWAWIWLAPTALCTVRTGPPFLQNVSWSHRRWSAILLHCWEVCTSQRHK